jgi:hypothetical protein
LFLDDEKEVLGNQRILHISFDFIATLAYFIIMTEEWKVLIDTTQKLDSISIEYMLTGSFAMNYYAAPRMTRDVDIVVNMTKKDVQPFLMTFSSEYHTSEQSILDAITRQSVFNVIHEEHIVKVDFVLRKNNPYRLLEFKRREKKEINGTTVYCVSQEDLILSKLAWGKVSGSQMQEMDVRNLMSSNLDWNYLNEWSEYLDIKEALDKCRK